MNSFHISLLLFLILISLQCSKIETEVNVERIEIKLNENSQLNLSNFFDSANYLKLETPSNLPIGEIFKIIEKDNYLFLFDRLQSIIFIFSSDLEFINEIRISSGRGPNEVEKVSDIYISNELEIHVLSYLKVLVYDIDGNLKNEFPIEFNPTHFAYLTNQKVYVGYVNNLINTRVPEKFRRDQLIYFDNSGIIIKAELPTIEGTEGIRYNIPNYFPESNDSLFFSPHLNDTVYVYKNFNFDPKYYLDFLDLKLPKEVFSNREKYGVQPWQWYDFWNNEIASKEYISLISSFEHSKKFIFLRFGSMRNRYIAMYDKKSKKIYTGMGNFNNDLNYGFMPHAFMSSNTKLYSFIEANDFLSHVRKISLERPDVYDSIKFSEVRSLANEITANGNPILLQLIFKE